ncbi:MAG TPA: hypothetical protein VLQ46_05645 [Casimicrobiaceae bacterium]|nr:hypothetical protein [Casimicrobiaceae bacterium]
MSFLTRIVVFWMIVIATISMLRLFRDTLPARLAFARLGPLPHGGEARSRYLLRWAAYWGSWVAQCALVMAACGFLGSRVAGLGESLWFLVLWAVVVPALAAIASLGCLAALLAAVKARWLGPDPVLAPAAQAGEVRAFLER